MKPAQVRFYFDEDILKLAHTIARLRPDCTYPGDPGDEIHRRKRSACPIGRGSKDTVWVPHVASLGWLIVSRDFRISENPAERRAVREAGARMVALSGEDARQTWGQLGTADEVLASHRGTPAGAWAIHLPGEPIPHEAPASRSVGQPEPPRSSGDRVW